MSAELLEDADILEAAAFLKTHPDAACGCVRAHSAGTRSYGRWLERVTSGVCQTSAMSRDHICIFGCGKKRIKRAVAAFDIHGNSSTSMQVTQVAF